MKIVNFGSCNIDYVYQLHHIVAVGETEHSNHRDVSPAERGSINPLPLQRRAPRFIMPGALDLTDSCFLTP